MVVVHNPLFFIHFINLIQPLTIHRSKLSFSLLHLLCFQTLLLFDEL